MSAEDYMPDDLGMEYEASWSDGDDYPSRGYYRTRNSVKTCTSCNKCHQSNLYWHLTSEGWRLGSASGVMHKCKQWYERIPNRHQKIKGIKNEIPEQKIEQLEARIKQLESIIQAQNSGFNYSRRHVNVQTCGHSPSKWIESYPPGAGYCQKCANDRYDAAGTCPYCGIKYGFAPGTGDCGCEVDPE